MKNPFHHSMKTFMKSTTNIHQIPYQLYLITYMRTTIMHVYRVTVIININHHMCSSTSRVFEYLLPFLRRVNPNRKAELKEWFAIHDNFQIIVYSQSFRTCVYCVILYILIF